MSDDSDRTSDESQTQRHSFRTIVLALLVFYPLSIGPIFGLLARFGVTEITGPVAYYLFPIICLSEVVPGGEDLRDRYLEFFEP